MIFRALLLSLSLDSAMANETVTLRHRMHSRQVSMLEISDHYDGYDERGVRRVNISTYQAYNAFAKIGAPMYMFTVREADRESSSSQLITAEEFETLKFAIGSLPKSPNGCQTVIEFNRSGYLFVRADYQCPPR